MPFRDLRAYLAKLDAMGELHRIPVATDPVLEISAITDRISKTPGGGKALWFERVAGSPFAVVTNLFGSQRRICAALQIDELTDLDSRLADLLALSAAHAFRPETLPYAPRVVAAAPCQEVVEEPPDLPRYPFLQLWPEDGVSGGRRTLTLPLVITRDPGSGRQNCGMYRVQLLEDGALALHWQPGSDGDRHWRAYAARDERMPVAIAVGGDPAVICAAAMPCPEPLDEMTLAGCLRQEPVELVRCLTSDLMVPAQTELVIEGEMAPGDTRPCGAFGNHTGFYVPAGEAPVLRVRRVTRRHEPIIPATVIGPPPVEDYWMAKVAERLLTVELRRQHPEIVDLSFIMEGVFHGCAVLAMRKTEPGQGRRLIEALWAIPGLRNARLLIATDADPSFADPSSLVWRMINRVDWRQDLIIAERTPTRRVPLPFETSRLGIDATRKLPAESGRPWPAELQRETAVDKLVSARWCAYGFED